MKHTRIISVFLALVLILSTLTACSRTPEELVANADKALSKKPYTVEIEVDYYSANSTVSGIFEQLERLDSNVYVDGKDIKAVSDLSINDGDTENRFLNVYTVKDGVVYLYTEYHTGEYKQEFKNKAVTDEANTKLLMNDIFIIGDISIADFSTVTLEKRDGENVIVCTGVSESRLISLEKALAKQMESTSEGIKADKVEMTIEIDGGKYDTITVKCDYTVTIQGVKYPVSMSVELEFDYDERFEITSPADAHEYSYVNIDQML